MIRCFSSPGLLQGREAHTRPRVLIQKSHCEEEVRSREKFMRAHSN